MMDVLFKLASIILVNIILSGDNAFVIAMASKNLPQEQQTRAICWGTAVAVLISILLTLGTAYILAVPYLQFVGGVLLVWIAIKLLIDNNNSVFEEKSPQGATTFWPTVRTIIIAYIVTCLDNTLAVAALAKGEYLLLIIGMMLSIPVVVFGSKIIVSLMQKLPHLAYFGAGVIAWTAGQLIVYDQIIGETILDYLPPYFIPLLLTVLVLGIGFWMQCKKYDEI